ncbi:MAG: flagellar type III secretion system pore protein FliP [Planctomycetes bacterium]|nr:flagellar type III secretion system pore protein FliP [Planctomycetota bacterium]
MASCRTIRLLALVVASVVASVGTSAQAQTAVPPSLSSPSPLGPSPLGPSQTAASLLPSGIGGPQQWTSPEGLTSTLQVMILLTVISLAPAVLLMTTSFIRILVVLGLLRQALGTQQLPPSQVITSIALFMTVLIMTPVWSDVYDQAIKPYTEKEINLEQAWDRGTIPVRRFMAEQIIRTDNHDDVYLFLKYMPSEIDEETGELPEYVFFDQEGDERIVPLQALLPAFMLSELKTAFLIGFQVYLPFVILDIVVASVTISMGMLMLPPVLISLPFKLLLFVLVDGWRLVVEMLLESFHI